MIVGGVTQAPLPVKTNRKDKKKKKAAHKRSGHIDRLQPLVDDHLLEGLCYDKPPAHLREAIQAYQDILVLARRQQVNVLFGVDLYA